MAKSKKSFVAGNPALQFISEPTEQIQPVEIEIPELVPAEDNIPYLDIQPETAPEGYKVNPMYIEKKTRRLQMLMQPSLHAKVKKAADRQGVSVNDYIHKVLEEHLKNI